MLYCSFVELDALLSIILIIVYGLFSLKSTQINLSDVFFFCRLFPFLFVLGFFVDMNVSGLDFYASLGQLLPTIDALLAILLFFVMFNFQSFESVLLLLFTFIGQYYMLHSMDLLTFYIALEAQNFCFLVLCGLPTVAASTSKHSVSRYNNVFSVEAAIKYFLLSAFSSGVLLFWFSAIYLQTGMSVLSFTPKDQSLYTDVSLNVFESNVSSSARIVDDSGLSHLNSFRIQMTAPVTHPPRLTEGGVIPDADSFLLDQGILDWSTENISVFLILCAMMFKLGAAPLHLWVVQIYNGVTKNLLLYISTAPKLSLFGFWVNSFQTVWTDYSIVLFSVFSIILGAFGAYSQPSLRSVLSYSTINEIGLLLSALETAGFNSLFQHLSIYVVSQLLLWNLTDKRLFTVLAVSLAGLPPLAGFFGKAWIFWQIGTVGLTSLLLIALLCTAVSLVYYIRIIRLFWNPSNSFRFDNNVVRIEQRIQLTSACVVLLFILPIFVIKPFII